MQWNDSYELNEPQAGIFARVSRDRRDENRRLHAVIFMAGASVADGSVESRARLKFERRFGSYELAEAKAWIEGTLLGAGEVGIEKERGSMSGLFGEGWAKQMVKLLADDSDEGEGVL